MNKKISVSEFVQLVEYMENKYPNAKVTSVGTSYRDGKIYAAIWLDDNGKEAVYRIPMYMED